MRIIVGALAQPPQLLGCGPHLGLAGGGGDGERGEIQEMLTGPMIYLNLVLYITIYYDTLSSSKEYEHILEYPSSQGLEVVEFRCCRGA